MQPMTDLDLAVVLLENQRPLPLDLSARLIDNGIDVESLEARYG